MATSTQQLDRRIASDIAGEYGIEFRELSDEEKQAMISAAVVIRETSGMTAEDWRAIRKSRRLAYGH